MTIRAGDIERYVVLARPGFRGQPGQRRRVGDEPLALAAEVFIDDGQRTAAEYEDAAFSLPDCHAAYGPTYEDGSILRWLLRQTKPPA